MSFILDAIAKSEQERRQLEIPDAEALSIPQQKTFPRRRWLPLLLVAALLINVAIVAVWIQSDKRVDNDSKATTEALPKAGQRPDEIIEIKKAVAQPVISEQETTPTTVLTPSSDDTRGDSDEAVDLPVASAGLEEGEDTEGWVRVQPDTLLNATRDSVSTGNPGVSEPNDLIVTRLYELPDSVRKDLPTVKFSGHLYSSNPASSVVFLDNQRPVMQGQRIVDEVFLHEITTDGVVVRFRGYLISVGVLQNWTLN
ncbi:MAG: general secretion pathway protein GspB [Gammaproteobacteria bacterium]|nr:general secretion pathway protein GspB [Gammaproteobacteria bacterium]